jgi:hypothetical protein
MKRKINYYSFAFLFWISIGLTNALAADFTLIDSDGDVYSVGPFLGKALNNESFLVQYTSNDFSTTGEGYLYYDDFYGSVKILIFENEETAGFTLEGIWEGDGSTIHYVDNRGQRTDLGLYFGNTLRSKRSKTTRLKSNEKK